MKPKRDTKEAILDAMLDLIVERGFHRAPMSLVSKRAQVSPGVIYHHFPSKDEMIHALYRRVKFAKRQGFFAGYSVDAPPAQAFVKMWVNAYAFYRTQIRETRFLDLYENSAFSKSGVTEVAPVHDEARTHFLRAFRAKKLGGLLKDLPQTAVDEFSWGLAARLAKKEETIKPAVLKRIAEAAWTAIAGA